MTALTLSLSLSLKLTFLVFFWKENTPSQTEGWNCKPVCCTLWKPAGDFKFTCCFYDNEWPEVVVVVGPWVQVMVDRGCQVWWVRGKGLGVGVGEGEGPGCGGG